LLLGQLIFPFAAPVGPSSFLEPSIIPITLGELAAGGEAV